MILYGNFANDKPPKMKKLLLLFLPCLLAYVPVSSQNTLFDDTRLSAIYITIPADSLAVLYDSVLSDHYYLARFIFDDNENRDTLDNVGFRLRGNTSRYSKKKSFKISFNEYVSGRKYQGVKKINLNGEHNDPTMIREKLFYDIWKNAGMVKRRTSFIKMYINGSYYGLYTNLEEMEKEWLTLVYPMSGGNLFKCTYPADLAYHGSNEQTYKDLENETVTGGRVYELQTNKSQDDYSRLVEMITILNQQPAGNFAQDVSTLLNVDHFLKALALDVATGNWDDYGYNRNNYYLYENPTDSKFDFITYDPDNTFGVDWSGIDWAARDCRNWINKKISLPLAQKLLAVPAFYEKYKLFLDTIARTVIDPDTVFPRIEAMKQLVWQAAVEDNYRTLDYGYTIADFDNAFIQAIDDHTPYGLKPFFTKRKQSILDQLHPAGVDGFEVSEQGISVFPNPAGETITFSLSDRTTRVLSADIFDLYGKLLMEFDLQDNNQSLSVESLAPGMYLLRVKATGLIFQAKFIKK
jgi:hypothetical protein